MPFDDRTGRDWPLPHADNHLETDVERIRDSLSAASDELTATETELARYEAETDETLAQHRRELDDLDRDKADEESVSWRFSTLEHDGLQGLQTGAWRHLTPLQLSAFPELEAGDKLTTEGRMIANVDLGAQTGSPAARLPEVGGLWAYVAGMGLYRLDRSSAALLDGETAFLPASGSGRWLMQSPAPDWMSAALLDMCVATAGATLTFTSIQAFSFQTKDFTVPSIASLVLRVDPPPALAGCDYTWTAEDVKGMVSGKITDMITGATTITVTYRNNTGNVVTPAAGEWTATYLKPRGASLTAWRFLNWLRKTRPDGAGVEAALAAAENAGAFAEFLDCEALFQRAFADPFASEALMGSPVAMRGVADCAWGRELLTANNAPANARFASLLDAAGLAGTLSVPEFWTAAASNPTNASAVMANEAALDAVLGSRTAMRGVGANSTSLLSQIQSSRATADKLCADGDLLANLVLSAEGLRAISNSTVFFRSDNEALALRLFDHPEVREAAFSVNTLQSQAKSLLGWLSGWGWTLAATAREMAVTADGANRSPGWSGPGLAFIYLGYASGYNSARIGIRYGESQPVPNAVRTIATPGSSMAFGTNCFMMPAGGWSVTIENMNGAYYAELWVPPSS